MLFSAREFLEATPEPPVNATSGGSGGGGGASASRSSYTNYDAPPPGAPPLPPAFYSRIASVPLLLSPALRLPDPPTFPQDLHPLPLDIAPYMIYPFSLEAHVLHPDPAAGGPLVEEDPLDVLQAARDFLAERAAKAERDRKAALQRIAPGWAELEGRAGVLEPKRKVHQASPGISTPSAVPTDLFAQLAASTPGGHTPSNGNAATPSSQLDDLAAQLAALDAPPSSASQPQQQQYQPSSAAPSSSLPPPPASATVQTNTATLLGL
ncbi:unnamed protein product [Tilletia controversa]|uniref:Uncharacterized protein n=3 Tax=Tilletia TaxID=13289 RepID=A0A8X7SX64_9BASI|nr:hypothetical protein CF336_g3145 [Tilletia laevis]KAE8200518.1 hypothetical protein CF328_g2944 [Tilletia controversa]KAE8264122.1 hypothetical protein A4X03_0g1172 [Tilletia caries]KAE8205571.1 hypothetical protein CF335_g2252 [Tilletia laevis]KAE8248471.1 hypothetical protein A4X06_0g3694 [Tilletia controversa]